MVFCLLVYFVNQINRVTRRGPAGTAKTWVEGAVIPVLHWHGEGVVLWKGACHTGLEGPRLWREELLGGNLPLTCRI